MRIRINGKDEDIKATNLAELVSELDLPDESLVVEHNRQIVRQEQWTTTALADDDVIELLSFVGGG